MQTRPFPFQLYLVTSDDFISAASFPEKLKQVLDGGVTAVQLRAKNTPVRTFIDLAFKARKVLQDYPDVPLIINDRVDIALAVDAAGVHVGQCDMPLELVRSIFAQKRACIGLSLKSPRDLQADDAAIADYYGVSPVFLTPTKPELRQQWGLEGLQALRKQTGRKLVAIGGISAGNARQVLASGADGLAVVSAICAADDPLKATKTIREIVDEHFCS